MLINSKFNSASKVQVSALRILRRRVAGRQRAVTQRRATALSVGATDWWIQEYR